MFIEDILRYQSTETPELFAASGCAFGRFQRLLDGYLAGTLYKPIPHFHDMEVRLEKLKATVSADRLGRTGDCIPEIAFAIDRESDCSVALNALRKGVLPLRVTHNNTKLNHVLVDPAAGRVSALLTWTR